MGEIKVSICCLTYNHEAYIADAIESFLMQKVNFPIEILIHDDASTDKTPGIIESYRKKHPDIIKPIYQSINQYSQGIKISLNFLWPKASGDYIALCEGDDYWIDPNKLQKQVDFMDGNTDCSVCFHGSQIIAAEGSIPTGKLIRPYKQSQIVTTKDIILGDGDISPTASLLFKRSSVENLPDFYFNSSVGDYPLILILASQGKAYYMDKIMSAYRSGVPGSWTTMNVLNDNIKGIINVCKDDIFILQEFNKYSKYIYNNIIRKCIINKRKIIMISYIKFFLKKYTPYLYKLLTIIKKNIFTP